MSNDCRCKHKKYDSDGDYCDIGMGYGVNSHCHLNFVGGTCAFYEPEKKPKDEKKRIGKFENPEALLKAYQSLEKEFTRKCQKLKEAQKILDRKKRIQETICDICPTADHIVNSIIEKCLERCTKIVDSELVMPVSEVEDICKEALNEYNPKA